MLLAYVITAFFGHVDWRQVLLATVRPGLTWSRDYAAMLVGILGTTISPYLFFWEASQEVEEERAQGRTAAQRKGATDEELRRLRVDVLTGMFASNFIMYFIILTTAATLHAHGVTKIETARQAAEALWPLAGKAAYLLFTLGLMGNLHAWRWGWPDRAPTRSLKLPLGAVHSIKSPAMRGAFTASLPPP